MSLTGCGIIGVVFVGTAAAIVGVAQFLTNMLLRKIDESK